MRSNRKGFVLVSLLIMLPLMLVIFSLILSRIRIKNISAHILLDCIESSAAQLENYESTQKMNAAESRTSLNSKIEDISKKYINIFTYEISNPIFELGEPPHFIRSLVYNVKLAQLKQEQHFTCGAKAQKQGEKNEWVYTIIVDKY